MSRMKELENLNEIFAVEKSIHDERVKIRNRKSEKMSKKFTFKHPAGTSPATAQAVPLSSSSSTASMMSVASVPSVVNMQDDDDLWLDDIDEDMLVQASQMVEAQAANATHDDRMEIDAETLNKVMKEESTSDDVWNEAASNPFQKQKYAPQTQTVFQTVSALFIVSFFVHQRAFVSCLQGNQPVKRPLLN